MGSIGLLSWRKAYMLEFLDNNTVKEVFTFSVPPESEDFVFAQRVSETKTFGGVVYDDYGNDTYKITLSGSTINEDKKLIYRGLTKSPLYLTGTKEIFKLQEIIKNWANGIDPMTGGKLSEKTKIYLYDLSKMSALQIAAGTASRNYWRVVIRSLKIKRDKSKPFTYNYTLEMDGMEETSTKKESLLSSLADAAESVESVMDSITSVMELVEGTTSALNQVATSLSEAKTLYETIKNRTDGASIALTTGLALDTVSRIFGGDSKSFYNSTQNVLSAFSTFKGLANGTSEDSSKSSLSQNTDVFTIYFESNGGSNVAYQRVSYADTVTKPDDPTLENYTFAGWYTDETLENEYDFTTEVQESFTLYAKWTLAIATITYNSKNGSRVASQTVAVGSTTTQPSNPIRSGYLFEYWCTDYDCTIEFDFDTPITENITLYAAWRQTCNVVFDSDGGTEIETQVIGLGELAVYPKTPKKENYTFAYWCTDEELQNVFDFSTQLYEDTTLYACYVQVSNTVTFDSQGGSSVDSQRIAIGGYATEPEAPTREGYDFVYWATDKAGTNEFKFTKTTITANITLYASWSSSVCSVTFDTDGGSEVATQSVAYGEKVIFPEIPTKDGYVFEMWCTRTETEVDSGEVDEDGNAITSTEYEYEEFDFDTVIKDDLTLYAQWFGGN